MIEKSITEGYLAGSDGSQMMDNTNHSERITTALVLAAGTGSRLNPLTNAAPKCLTLVNEKEILGRLVDSLHQYRFKRLVIVVGPFEQQIRDYLDKVSGSLIVEYIISSVYKTTNNIYSLWLAREKIKEPFILIESDLIFKPSLLKDMLLPGKIAVSRILPWMNGTTITINTQIPHQVSAFNLCKHSKINKASYKTVNIYSFSLASWKRVCKRLDSWISAGKVNDYYEAVFAEMVADRNLAFQCVYFDMDQWYEIDTMADLHACEKMLQHAENNQPLTM